jgi:serine/threonine protein kinase
MFMLFIGPLFPVVLDCFRLPRNACTRRACTRTPCVPIVHDYGVEKGAIVLVSSPVGETSFRYLARKFRERDAKRETQIRAWAVGLFEFLHVLHRFDLVHGDLKPSNLIVTESANLCVIDFGLATRINTSVFGFTREFASDQRLDERHHTNSHPDDDFISICYTLHSLYVGLDSSEVPQRVPLHALASNGKNNDGEAAPPLATWIQTAPLCRFLSDLPRAMLSQPADPAMTV